MRKRLVVRGYQRDRKYMSRRIKSGRKKEDEEKVGRARISEGEERHKQENKVGKEERG